MAIHIDRRRSVLQVQIVDADRIKINGRSGEGQQRLGNDSGRSQPQEGAHSDHSVAIGVAAVVGGYFIYHELNESPSAPKPN